ncbi:MAG: ROK family protein [Propionicimonas sp.]|uniref:ROK family protein n=1 Tax=Propionicimonas sp. TaxID=1955623 RepID=UPI003D0A2DB0
MYPVSPQDPWVQVAEVVRLIRTGEAQTRPELADATRLGRNIITQRVQAAQELDLVRPSGTQRSRGGRAADVWEFSGHEGRVLTGLIGLTGLRVTLSDLANRVIEDRRIPSPLTIDPIQSCELMATEMEGMLARHHAGGRAWGIGLGVLAPVDFSTGRSADPVTSSTPNIRWPREFDVRTWLTRRMQAPVWVESVSNLAALGAAAEPGAPSDLVFVRLDRGVGSGIISDGRLHRGADWIAGEITHIVVNPDSDRICLCGRVGCLDAYASRWAIEADARRAVAEGRSPHLAAVDASALTLADVVAGADAGDPTCTELVVRAADAMGRALASVVTWFNPRRVVVGGNELADSSLFLGTVSRTLHAQALAASVQNLELRQGRSDRFEEVTGANTMVVDALLSPDYLAEWGPEGFPIDVEVLLARQSR